MRVQMLKACCWLAHPFPSRPIFFVLVVPRDLADRLPTGEDAAPASAFCAPSRPFLAELLAHWLGL